jgi:hypothetical protein
LHWKQKNSLESFQNIRWSNQLSCQYQGEAANTHGHFEWCKPQEINTAECRDSASKRVKVASFQILGHSLSFSHITAIYVTSATEMSSLNNLKINSGSEKTAAMMHLTSKLYFQSLLLPESRTVYLILAPTVRRSYIFDFCRCSWSAVDTGRHDPPPPHDSTVVWLLRIVCKVTLRTPPSVRRKEFSSKGTIIHFRILYIGGGGGRATWPAGSLSLPLRSYQLHCAPSNIHLGLQATPPRTFLYKWCSFPSSAAWQRAMPWSQGTHFEIFTLKSS